jgi:sulfonate transport system ATP-binding protein
MSTFLDVQITQKKFGDHCVLDNLHFCVEQGELVTFIGPSGCGKTTVFKILLGLDLEYSGEVMLDGRKVDGPGLDRAPVFQEPRLIPWKNVRANIEFAKNVCRSEDQVTSLIDLVGLKGFENYWPKQISGGMAQRVGLARALVNSPKLLLMDEPFGALDHLTRLEMQNELRDIHHKKGATTVLITHDIDEAIFLSDRVFVLSRTPATITGVTAIDLKQPRVRTSEAFNNLKIRLLDILSREHS